MSSVVGEFLRGCPVEGQMTLDEFKLQYRQMLVEQRRLQDLFSKADFEYEEAYTKREEAQSRLCEHQASIIDFLNQFLGGLSGERMGVRLAVETDSSVDRISTKGVIAR